MIEEKDLIQIVTLPENNTVSSPSYTTAGNVPHPSQIRTYLKAHAFNKSTTEILTGNGILATATPPL